MSLLAKINCSAIVKAHTLTLVDGRINENKIFSGDVFLFYLAPAVLAFPLGFFLAPTDTFVNVLITSLSVFAALLFNLLMLVLGVIEKRKGNNNFIVLQRETYANISYAILVSLIAVGLLLIPALFSFDEKTHSDNWIVYGRKTLWFAIFFLLINFSLTMAMVLKRMHKILVKLLEF